jgi:DNA/RNA endonuclease G (NUC1)
MRPRSHVRSLATITLLLLAAGTAWAEYCQSQGSPRLPKSQIGPFDAAAFLTTSEIIDSEARHLPWGRPDCPQLLFHAEYVLCYDIERKAALWASYRLEVADVVAADRVNAFRTDPRLPIEQNPSCDDYRGSGFDRGHMVPRADMNRSVVALVNTFFLTNMTPQHPNVNQGAWARLEDWARAWATVSGGVHIISGSVFDDDDDEVPDAAMDARLSQGATGVAVPSHYYKIVIRETAPGQFEAIALLIPNQPTGVPGPAASNVTQDDFLRVRIRSIAETRRRTGLDLLPAPPFDKATLEEAVASDLWPRN